jgi:phenylacetate-CoA ligase
MHFIALRQFLTTTNAVFELRRNQRLSRPQLEAIKLQKFRRLVAHAARHSQYYAQIIRDGGIAIESCTPEQFPVLTKTAFMENFDRISTDPRVTKAAIEGFLSNSTDPNERFLGEYQVIHTSGSSGHVGYFVFSVRDWARAMAQFLRTPAPSQFFRKTKLANFLAVGGHYGGASMAKHWIRGHGKYLVDLLLLEINSPLSDVIDKLNAQQPHILNGYTSALKLLAAKQREGVLNIAPRIIQTGAEPASASDIAELRTTFGAAIFNNYGSSEHLLMGMSADPAAGMTLFDDELIYEMYDDHTVVTNLFNFTVPLIRYRMSDILRPMSTASSKFPYLKIESIVGRSEIVPMFVNDHGDTDFISPNAVVEIFVAGVQRFQLHWLGPTSFRFVACLDSALTLAQRQACVTGLEQRLQAMLDLKRMRNVKFDVELVEDLPVNAKSRKFQLIVDRRNSAN